MTGQTGKTLSTYKVRHKVIADRNGAFDDSNPTNAAFLAAHKVAAPPTPEAPAKKKAPKGSAAQKSAPTAKPEEDVLDWPDDMDEDDNKIRAVGEVDRFAKHWMGVKNKRQALIAQLELDKKKALLVPSELIKGVYLAHTREIGLAFKELIEREDNLHIAEFKISSERAAKLRKSRIELVNSVLEKALNATKAKLKTLENEYAETRNVGERGK